MYYQDYWRWIKYDEYNYEYARDEYNTMINITRFDYQNFIRYRFDFIEINFQQFFMNFVFVR